jgi:uncharacterized protein YciI
MDDARIEADRIMHNLVREQCYLLMMRPAENPPEDYPKSQAELRIDHHAYLVELERRGVLFAAGPCRDDEGWVRGTGILMVRAANRAEARAIADAEPYTAAGFREVEIVPWQRNEGVMSVNLRLADGVLEIDNRRWRLSPEGE